MVKINPSLMFSGTCGEAFRRYASLFGGEIVNMLTYAESPLAREVPPEWRDKVWYRLLGAHGHDRMQAEYAAMIRSQTRSASGLSDTNSRALASLRASTDEA